jgi:hypothetical protein
MSKKFSLLGAPIVAILALMGFSASIASASSTSSNCSSPSPGLQICNVQKVASSSSPGSFKVNPSSRVSTKGKIVVLDRTNIPLPKYNPKECVYVGKNVPARWIPGQPTCIKVAIGVPEINSYPGENGQPVRFHDKTRAGHQDFVWNSTLGVWQNTICHNEEWFFGNWKTVPKNRLEIVNSFNEAKITLSAVLAKHLHGKVSAQVSCSVNGASASAKSYGTDDLKVTIRVTATGTTYAQAKARAQSKAIKQYDQEDISLSDQVYAAATDKLQASASASCKSSTTTPPPVAVCTVTTATNYGQPLPCTFAPPAVCTDTTANNYGQLLPCTYTTPPQHWVEISCTGFEEITGGGSFLVTCAVSDDNGAPISLLANANDANSTVSGINCVSNGGSQTCPSGGTFQFRVDGINNGSTTLYSSLDATASANGVSQTFKSGSYAVDPSDGGF